MYVCIYTYVYGAAVQDEADPGWANARMLRVVYAILYIYRYVCIHIYISYIYIYIYVWIYTYIYGAAVQDEADPGWENGRMLRVVYAILYMHIYI